MRKTTADAVAKLQGLETAETERVVIPYANSPVTMQKYYNTLRYERIPAIHPECGEEVPQRTEP